MMHEQTIAPLETGLGSRAWTELNLDALRYNVAALRGLLPPGCELMPAVKGDAYGHGALPVARELEALDVRAFCVACAEEGAQLRAGGIQGDILILGRTDPRQFDLLRRCNLIQTVVDAPYAEALAASGSEYRVHVGIDTGMHRLGEPCTNIEALARIWKMPGLQIEGTYTHLYADDLQLPDGRAAAYAQAAAFREAVARLRMRGCAVTKTHLLASGGLLHMPELGGDYARAGIALYGVLSTRAELGTSPVELRPVLSVKTRVTCVKTLRPGMGAGYGLAFQAARETRLGVLAIGYADGLPRTLSGGVGEVLIRARHAPIVGRICMDQTLVDLTDIPDARPGDTAVVIGRSGDETITACDVAERAGTIANEILSRLGKRLERYDIYPEASASERSRI